MRVKSLVDAWIKLKMTRRDRATSARGFQTPFSRLILIVLEEDEGD